MQETNNSILKGAKQALDYAKGNTHLKGYGVHIPEDIDVKRIRQRLEMTQFEFAARYGLQVNAVKNWEQDRRKPEGAARTLLHLIDRAPKVIEELLHAD